MNIGTAILERLDEYEEGKREKRILELLRDPVNGGASGWSVYLPLSFNAALDLAITQRVVEKDGEKRTISEWTQGSAFAFAQGDIIYDTVEAYSRWDNALQEIGFCFEVVAAASAVPRQKETPRYPGRLLLKVSQPNASRERLQTVGQVEVTQDEFVRFVVLGESRRISALVDDT